MSALPAALRPLSGNEQASASTGAHRAERAVGKNSLVRLQENPQRYGLFAALRVLEQAFPDRPRFGESRKAVDDAARLGNAPHLTFAPSDVTSFEMSAEQGARLEQHSFGVFGPNGALPLHLTEHAYERRRQQDDATLVDFVNVFQHRLISLFYRAWANSDPATSFDRPQSDRFVMYLGALQGLAPAEARGRDAVLDYAKLSRAGLYNPQPRSAEGLETVLADYFGLQVEVRQLVGAWLDIPEELRCRLGGPRELATLGQGATVGKATWQCQHKFEIVLGPLTLSTLKNFLPGARGLKELYALTRLYTGDEWTWQLRLLLRDAEIPGIRMGRLGQLGWTTWLGKRENNADDVLIQEHRAATAHQAWSLD
jgi:type VI secretion system protein ImpH